MDREELAALVQSYASPYIDARPHGVLSVGVCDATMRQRFVFGRVDPAVRPVYEIGSITKVFTAILFADLVETGLLRADDPLEKFLGHLVAKPFPAGGVTLQQLVTHTSGLPRLPRNIWWRSVIHDWRNPYAKYTADDLYRYLARFRPRDRGHDPVAKYSNLGVALLAHVMSLVTGHTFATMVEERISRRIGLRETFVSTVSTGPPLVQGYGRKGKPMRPWDAGLFVGAGGLCASLQDMLTFLRAQFAEDALSCMRQCHRDTGIAVVDSPLHMGWGWMVGPSGMVVHNGRTGGHSSWIGFHLIRQAGVVVMSNYADGSDLDTIGLGIAKQIVGIT